MQITEMIEAIQRKLKIQVDGRAGSQTWGAIYAAVVEPTIRGATPEQALSKVDHRSEKNIATLLPEVQSMARTLVQKAASNGIHIKIISGLRTYAEQDALYARGRTAPGPKVTNARGGYSNHCSKSSEQHSPSTSATPSSMAASTRSPAFPAATSFAKNLLATSGWSSRSMLPSVSRSSRCSSVHRGVAPASRALRAWRAARREH